MGTKPSTLSSDVRGRGTARSADVSAMLRLMRPLGGSGTDHAVDQQRLLADVLRLVGRHATGAADLPPPPPPQAGPVAGGHGDALPPRQEQTLQLLLNGDSEKQVARRLNLSPHTVHVYVKALYRRFDVSSRAELLARHLRR